MNARIFFSLVFIAILFVSCERDKEPLDPTTAERVEIDRFSEVAGTLYIRNETNNLPEPGEPVDFDKAPFLNHGLGPNGEKAVYYDFDVQPLETAPIYVLFREGENDPVEGQLNIIDVIPGETGYNDFWSMVKVSVPSDYIANTVTSLEEIEKEGFPMERTTAVINCPVAPEGSTAALRYNSAESASLDQGWYKSKAVFYFTFIEKDLTVGLPPSGNPYMPLSGILVTFNINPDEEGGGPPSGFVMEEGGVQTHNVLETLPEDEDYSPLWTVSVYDNADFDNVSNWESANNATILGKDLMYVNCPVVEVN